MLTGDTVDTVLNLLTFAFVGVMIWLLLRDLPARRKDQSTEAPHDTRMPPDRSH